LTSIPFVYVWTGDGFVPARGYAARAARDFKPGEAYTLEVREDRSPHMHRHYFAAIAEAFANLDERVTNRLKTPEHLRKWALIETGHYDETITDCGSHEVALRMAAFTRRKDDYSEIIVRGNLLCERTAKSQSVRVMNKEDFKQSSRDVLDLLSDMINVNRTALERYAGRVAS
jgi:hypothetical protein